MINRLSFFLLLSFLFQLSFGGRDEVIHLENFNSKQGLSNDWINTITEDHQGFLWLGTRHGLNVFNGNSTECLNHSPYDSTTLSSDDISSVLSTQSELIIAGTWGGGINLIDPITKQVRHPREKGRYDRFAIKSIKEGRKGDVWIGTYGDGFYHYDLEKDHFTKCDFKGLDSTLFNYCEDLHYFQDTVWVATRAGGLAFISPETLEIIPFKTINKWPKDYKQITAIHDDKVGLLLGTHYGDFFKIDTHSKLIHSVKDFRKKNDNARITDINFDSEGVIWVSATSGFYKSYKAKYDFYELVSVETGSPYYDNFCTYIDSRGLLWIGTWGKGLNGHGLNEYRFNHIDFSGFQTNNIKALYELNDTTILLGSSSGILAFNTLSKKVYRPKITGDHSEKLLNNVIAGISDFHDDVLVSIEGKGLFILSPDLVSSEFKHNKESIFNNTMLTDVSHLENGETWIGTWTKGGCMIDESNDSIYYFVTQNGKSINQIYTTFMDKSGLILLGTRDGMYSFDSESLNFSFHDFQAIGGNKAMQDIQAISEDKNGNLWFSASNGLMCYSHKNKRIIGLPRENPDFHHVFYRMIMVGDELWGTTNSGLIKVNVTTFRTAKYTINDGLLSNSFFRQGILKTKNGELYLGNGDGVIYFDLDVAKHTKVKPNVFINEMFISDNEINENAFSGVHISKVKKIELEYDQNNISFNLNVLDFSKKNEEIFAHKLIGFDSKWLKHTRSDDQIKYTNLNPGVYKIAYGVLVDGEVLEEEIKSITINISAPYWETWWFRLMAFAITLGVIVLIVQQRNKAIVKQKKLLEQKVEERTHTISQKNKELREQKEAVNSNLRYASLLQKSLLPKSAQIGECYPNHFIFYRPQALVSGDFYWSTKKGSKNIFVSTDCTGHGVSGAFLSVLGISTLKSIVEVSDIIRPDLVLNELHNVVKQSFKEGGNDLNDGMDISVTCYDTETKILEVASAKSSPIIVNSKGFTRLRGDKFPIGGDAKNYPTRKPYELKRVEITERSMLYLFTDGYQDQFGGSDNKKYMQKNFRDFLISNSELKTASQLKIIEQEFDAWKGDLAQIDDVLVVGLEINPKS